MTGGGGTVAATFSLYKAAAIANGQRGQGYNEAHKFDDPYREVPLVKPSGGRPAAGRWVPGWQRDCLVKATQLAVAQEATPLKSLRELANKSPPVRNITNVPSSGPPEGQPPRGRQVLEVPIQQQPVPRRVVQEANNLGIITRDVNGTKYHE